MDGRRSEGCGYHRYLGQSTRRGPRKLSCVRGRNDINECTFSSGFRCRRTSTRVRTPRWVARGGKPVDDLPMRHGKKLKMLLYFAYAHMCTTLRLHAWSKPGSAH